MLEKTMILRHHLVLHDSYWFADGCIEATLIFAKGNNVCSWRGNGNGSACLCATCGFNPAFGGVCRPNSRTKGVQYEDSWVRYQTQEQS